MRVHSLKCLTVNYKRVISGTKPFEIRKNDRGYKEGDLIILCDFDGENLTGWTVVLKILSICDYEQKPNYVVLGVRVLSANFMNDENKKESVVSQENTYERNVINSLNVAGQIMFGKPIRKKIKG